MCFTQIINKHKEQQITEKKTNQQTDKHRQYNTHNKVRVDSCGDRHGFMEAWQSKMQLREFTILIFAITEESNSAYIYIKNPNTHTHPYSRSLSSLFLSLSLSLTFPLSIQLKWIQRLLYWHDSLKPCCQSWHTTTQTDVNLFVNNKINST